LAFGVARPLQQLRQLAEDRRREAGARRRLARGQTHFTPRAREPRHRVHQKQHAPALIAVVQQAAYEAAEGGPALRVTVIRTGDSSGPLTVEYATADGTATQRGDYAYAAGRLTFAAGQTSQSFDVLIGDDAYLEGPESLTLSLTNVTGGSTGSPAQATLTITDDDTADSGANPSDDATTTTSSTAIPTSAASPSGPARSRRATSSPTRRRAPAASK
jgi:hypothetical protein